MIYEGCKALQHSHSKKYLKVEFVLKLLYS